MYTLPMSGKRAFEAQIAVLDALREQPEESRLPAIRKALTNRNNFLVGKAADLVREFHLTDLTPDLLTAFDRFFENPEKTDPQCWAKNAIGRALSALEYQEPEPFLRGMRHVQLEAVWGGRSDSAAPLRAACALALVQCRGLREHDLLTHLVDLMADPDKTVRAEVARALAQIGSNSALLLLRLKAVSGDSEPEVLGACYSGILQIEGARAIPWACRFLSPADDFSAEAALAIAETHTPEALAALRDQIDRAQDPWFRSVLLSAISLTRQDAAFEFLFEVVEKNSPDSEVAIKALLRAGAPEIMERLENLTAANPRLARVLAANRK